MNSSSSQTTLPAIAIRPATRDDVAIILTFIRELASYEREPDAVFATEADLVRDGFSADSPRRFDCVIGSLDGEPAGFALYFHNYSTWRGRAGIHLEDLFVRPEFRGNGLGRALIEEVARLAVAEGCVRMQWDVLEWNLPAVGFYEQMGAAMLLDWRTMRVVDERLKTLGAGS